LGEIEMKKYSFNKYSNDYKQLFSRERSKLRKVLPNVKIEHVGSTSIPGLGGKGIIDIAIRIPKSKLSQFMEKLEKLGYESAVDHPVTKTSAFLQEIIKNNGKERRVHVHLVFDDTFWESFILFRDYLRNHDEVRDEYAGIKKEGVRHAKGEAEKYRKHKKAFLEKIMRFALKKK
jgi:GrpB-like predicted nucleotidyltransferase (UPF0157 family)